MGLEKGWMVDCRGRVGEGAPAGRGMDKSREVRPGLGERGDEKEEEGRTHGRWTGRKNPPSNCKRRAESVYLYWL